MLLTQNIIRKLIKEEIQDSLNLKEELSLSGQDLDDKINSIVSSLGNIKKSQQVQILQKVEAKINEAPANRKDIEEACGDMQSIDMGVDHHDDDHEGSMAKRQMFKTAEYAAEIFDNIHDDDEFPAWIQSKMTKIADYIGAVKHYLEYDHVMGEAKLTKKQIKGRDKDAETIKKSTIKQYGKEEGTDAAYAIATNIQKEKAKKKK
tara:strand:- start:60 stop:674 length:615 start_codon:yes stop_codon:yes gene_type:complete